MNKNSAVFTNITASELHSASKALRLMLVLLEVETMEQSFLWRLFFGFKNTRRIINELMVVFETLADIKNEQKNEDNTVNQK